MIYFDNASTTKPFDEVLQVFDEINREYFANPSSNHYFGEKTAHLLNEARDAVISSLNLNNTYQCLFLSGATESDNLALKGIAFSYANRGRKIITDAVEHPAVLIALQQLKEQFGFEVVILPVRNDGTADPEVLLKAMDDKTILVSVMAVNNEVGSINDIASLGQIVHRFHKAFFHVDATQAVGKEKIDYSSADLISFSGHKFGATKGTGCLIYKKNIHFQPLISGGEQEFGFRAGTVNVAGYCALAKALAIVTARQEENHKKLIVLHDRLLSGLKLRSDVVINSPVDGAPCVVNFSLKKKKASVVMEALSRKEIYVSSVSACSSKTEKVSYVLLSMGKTRDEAANGIRVSFSPNNTLEEVDIFLKEFDSIMKEVHDR